MARLGVERVRLVGGLCTEVAPSLQELAMWRNDSNTEALTQSE